MARTRQGRQSTFPGRPSLPSEGTIHDAVRRVDLEQVKAMLAADRALMNSQHDEFTPLRLAVYYDHLDVVSVLLECGADASELRNEARPETSVLAEAFHREREFHVEIVELLLSHGAHFPGLTPLLGKRVSVYDMQMPMLKVLVHQKCIDLVTIDDTLPPARRHTLLSEATLWLRRHMVAALLHAGADPRASPFEVKPPSWIEELFEEHEVMYQLIKARLLREGVAMVEGRGQATKVAAHLEGRVSASQPLPAIAMAPADVQQTTEDGTVPHPHSASRSPTVASPGTLPPKRRAVSDSASDRAVRRAVVKHLVFQGLAEQLLPELMEMSG